MVALIVLILPIFTLGATASGEIDFIALEDRQILSPKNRNESQKIIETSENIFTVTGKYATIRERFGADMNILVLKRKSSTVDKDYIYLKDNAYIGFFPDLFQLNVGRKIFTSNARMNLQQKDGFEGISIEKNLNKNFTTYLFLYDLYRGFPLFEKNMIRPKTDIEKENGKRARHGIELDYEKGNLFANIQFLYLNFGNWGKYSSDDFKKRMSGFGDGDFLYQTKFLFGKKWETLFINFTFYFSRGLDKSPQNTVRQEKSIPISGEALVLSAGWDKKVFSFNIDIFLPDSDKKNRAKEILELGFIGMGANPIDSIIISQSLYFHPSTWVTPSSMEKNDSFLNGKMNSLYVKTVFSVNLSQAAILLEAEKILPRLVNKESKGEISFKEKDYSKESLSALTISVQTKNRESSEYFLKFSVSKLISTKGIGISSTLLYFQAGICI